MKLKLGPRSDLYTGYRDIEGHSRHLIIAKVGKTYPTDYHDKDKFGDGYICLSLGGMGWKHVDNRLREKMILTAWPTLE